MINIYLFIDREGRGTKQRLGMSEQQTRLRVGKSKARRLLEMIDNIVLPGHARPAVVPRRSFLPFPLPGGEPVHTLLSPSLLQDRAHPTAQHAPIQTGEWASHPEHCGGVMRGVPRNASKCIPGENIVLRCAGVTHSSRRARWYGEPPGALLRAPLCLQGRT